MTDSGSGLRSVLEAGGEVVAAGCFDPLSAWIAADAGFPAVHLSGFAADAAQLAAPDVGLGSMSERMDLARRITEAVDRPLVCDVEDGWGDEVAVTRTIRAAVHAGVAAVHLEDQASPKRCPALGGRTVLDAGRAEAKIRAASAARGESGMLLIGRSDADAVSFDELVERCRRYADAGADMVLPMLSEIDGRPFAALEAAEQRRVVERLRRRVPGPIAIATVPAGMTVADLHSAGFALVLLPLVSLRAMMNAVHAALADALVSGTASRYFARADQRWEGSGEILSALGAERYLELERAFRTGG